MSNQVDLFDDSKGLPDVEVVMCLNSLDDKFNALFKRLMALETEVVNLHGHK